MRRLLTLLALLLPLSLSAAAPLPLSDAARASVITCGPGDDFYLAFGHSAIRIVDSAQGLDYVYNFGTFDFDTPHFYLRFAQGQLDYCLSRTTMQRFLLTYAREGRWVAEQPLLLSPQEVNNLFLGLEWTYLPENRYYRYDFFRDNCATRVRDMVEGALGHRSVAYADTLATTSFRQALRRFESPQQQWWSFGVDLLLGARCDRRRSERQLCFLPLTMAEAFDRSSVTPSSAASADPQRLVAPSRRLLDDTRADRPASFPPLVASCLLLVAVALLSVAARRRSWNLAWMDRLLFFLAGLAGLFLLFMWLGTSHWCTKWNLNVLWLSPLFLLLMLRPRRNPRWALWLQLACLAVALLLCLVGWPQRLNIACLPLIVALAVRVADGLKD